ncbi:MAG TPA: universal stress protein [Casimicrobiaceae bacterium]
MLRVTLAVDGSPGAVRATEKLIDSLGWYKEIPRIDLVTVHLPVPRFPNMSLIVSEEMIASYYAEESEMMFAPSRRLLDAAGVKYAAHTAVGPIAERIVEQAKESESHMIYMGTRGMTALSNMMLGSVATRVLHLAHVPVVLVH